MYEEAVHISVCTVPGSDLVVRPDRRRLDRLDHGYWHHDNRYRQRQKASQRPPQGRKEKQERQFWQHHSTPEIRSKTQPIFWSGLKAGRFLFQIVSSRSAAALEAQRNRLACFLKAKKLSYAPRVYR